MLNKQILITAFEVEDALISIMFEGYYKKNAKQKIEKLDNEKKLDKGLIEALEKTRSRRNNVHLNVKEGNCTTDYKVFEDPVAVINAIDSLNQLFAEKLPEKVEIKLQNI